MKRVLLYLCFNEMNNNILYIYIFKCICNYSCEVLL